MSEPIQKFQKKIDFEKCYYCSIDLERIKEVEPLGKPSCICVVCDVLYEQT